MGTKYRRARSHLATSLLRHHQHNLSDDLWGELIPPVIPVLNDVLLEQMLTKVDSNVLWEVVNGIQA